MHVDVAVRALGPGLLAFAFCDDHVHLLVHVSEARQPAVARAVRRILQSTAGPTAPAWSRAVTDRAHALSLLAYFARQPDHHGFPGHRLLWSGGCVSNMLGIRDTPGFSPAWWQQAFPRGRPLHLYRALGYREPPLAGSEMVRATSPAKLTQVTADALDTSLVRRTQRAATARCMAVHLGHRAGYATASLADGIGRSSRRVRQILGETPDPAWSALVRRRLAVLDMVSREG